MVEVQDASTLTDVCISDYLPEVELISLVGESLPRYKLRADSITDFTTYHHQDWGVQPPFISPHDLHLSNEQIQEVFKYFLLCGERVCQMTKVYDDIEAVTHLLEEKEKDLELAARIGQTLLEQNKHLVVKCEQLEAEVTSYQEQTAQLKHDLSQKEQLLQLLAADELVDSSREPSPSKESNSKYVELVQKKLSNLQEQNSLLKAEITSLSDETQRIEQHERQLTGDCIKQLNEAQIRLKELQAEADRKGVDLIKCQEECSTVIQQLVSGQQKMKELTIENLDMKETIKTSNEIQQELVSELFELKEKYRECKDLLDCTKHEVDQLKIKSSPRVATNRYYTGPCYIPPEGSFAAELESLNGGDKDLSRKSNSKVLETAQYVRKLSSKPSSPSSSMCSNSGKLPRSSAKSLLHSVPIPGSPMTRPSMMPSAVTGATSTPKSLSHSVGPSSQFFDEIERHRQNLGRPGIPGSKDLDTALKRLSLRRQNEESEKDYRERRISGLSTMSADSRPQEMEWSGASTPTVRSPSPESELSGYGSASSFGYRMPDKLQIVKPMEGSATLHHWQRLATPHMAGIFEERDGVQIKHEQPLNDLDSTTYSVLDVEEEVVPMRPAARSMFTNTVTDARVLHPSMTSYSVQSMASTSTTSVTASSGSIRYSSGIISRLDGSHRSVMTSALDSLHGIASLSAQSANVTSVNTSKPFTASTSTPTNSFIGNPSKPLTQPRSSYISFSSSMTTDTRTSSVMSSVGGHGLSSLTNSSPRSSTQPAVRSQPGVSTQPSFNILSNFYRYMIPSPAATTTNSGLSSIVSDVVLGDTRATRGAYGRWQSSW